MKKLKMKSNEYEGILISFCGLDGCGKTTMINKLCDEISDEKILFLTKQPTDFVRSSAIFRTYMDTENHDSYDYRSLSLLAASDRLQHVNKIIIPELEKGKIVISDRYFYSCLANLHARGYEKDKWIYEISESVIKPDISFFINVPVETAVERVRSRIDEKYRYIDMDLQYRLKDKYMEICKKNGGVLLSSVVPPEETFSIINKKVREVMERKWKLKTKYMK